MLYGNGMKINKIRNAGGDNNITNQPLHIPQKCNGYECVDKINVLSFLTSYGLFVCVALLQFAIFLFLFKYAIFHRNI